MYLLIDKYLRIHVKLTIYLLKYSAKYATILVGIAYLLALIVVLVIYHTYIQNQIKTNPLWIYFFTAAISLKVVSLFSDFLFHDITEDYFEAFSLFFFASAFLIALIQTNLYMPNTETSEYEDSNIPSTNQ